MLAAIPFSLKSPVWVEVLRVWDSWWPLEKLPPHCCLLHCHQSHSSLLIDVSHCKHSRCIPDCWGKNKPEEHNKLSRHGIHGLTRALLSEPGKQGTQHASILTSFWKLKETVTQLCFLCISYSEFTPSEKETNGLVKGSPVTISPTDHAAAQFGLRVISTAWNQTEMQPARGERRETCSIGQEMLESSRKGRRWW